MKVLNVLVKNPGKPAYTDDVPAEVLQKSLDSGAYEAIPFSAAVVILKDPNALLRVLDPNIQMGGLKLYGGVIFAGYEKDADKAIRLKDLSVNPDAIRRMWKDIYPYARKGEKPPR